MSNEYDYDEFVEKAKATIALGGRVTIIIKSGITLTDERNIEQYAEKVETVIASAVDDAHLLKIPWTLPLVVVVPEEIREGLIVGSLTSGDGNIIVRPTEEILSSALERSIFRSYYAGHVKLESEETNDNSQSLHTKKHIS